MTAGCGATLEWETKGGKKDGAACVSDKPHDREGDEGHVWDRGSWRPKA